MFPCHQAMWLIKPGVVLRKKLQGFSLGHAFLLEAMESPFMRGGNITLGDLAVAVLVCSMPFAKARKYLMRPASKLQRDAEWWGFWCRLRGFDFLTEVEKFKDYIGAYSEFPDAYHKQATKRHKTALPQSIRLAWCLMGKMPEADVWACPMSRALAYYTAEAEFNGQEFMTEEEAIKLKVM